jgi:hypothetical protein
MVHDHLVGKKARLFRAKDEDKSPTNMWVFWCPCEHRYWQYWHFAAAYGTMLWHMKLYHSKHRHDIATAMLAAVSKTLRAGEVDRG